MEDKHKAVEALRKVSDLITNAKCSIRLKVINDVEPRNGIGI